MFATVINDCRDDNAAGRQLARAQTLLSCPATFVGVANDLEAAGNLVDALDASEGRKGVVLVNVAPRNKKVTLRASSGQEKWLNGTPFCYFYYKDTLVLSSIGGLTLSLIKKLGVIDSGEVLDIPEVTAQMAKKGELEEETRARIINSQFRSFDFLPRAAAWLLQGKQLPSEKLFIKDVPEAPKSVWWVDNFGNCKTTLLPEEIPFEVGNQTNLGGKRLRMFSRLKDVPNDELGLVVGSSGLDEKRFLEVVAQGGSAAKELGIV